MLLSMTGFGKAESDFSGKNISVTVKSVNGKLSDVNLRIPAAYRERENEIRSLVNRELERGKIEVSVLIDRASNGPGQVINKEFFQSFYAQFKELTRNSQVSDEHLFEMAARMPGIVSAEKEQFDEKEWGAIMELLPKALSQLVEFRKTEGQALTKDLDDRIRNILDLQNKVKAFENERIERLRKKITSQLDELDHQDKIDRDRFEQEMIFYLERLDITEENIRLSAHGKFFLETMNAAGSQGKKLSFISQEIGREINTIGSKANHADMQKVVVEMKDELEKIKEQLQNVL